MTTIVTIDMGGTGATHAAGAREALSVPSMTDMGQSYAQANSARDQANTARDQANTARNTSNNAYAQANTGRSDANTTFASINTTFETVNTSLSTMNINLSSAQTWANIASFAAYGQANTARGTANDAYAQANAGYIQANAAYGAANTRLSASGGTLSGDLIITGNLTVSGNQTILNTEVLTTEDAEIILLSNTSSTPALNAGLIVNRGTSTNTFLRWNEALDEWGWSDSGNTTYYFEDLRQGLSTTNTTFGTVNTSLGTINTSYQAAYAQANTAGTNAGNAYGQANTSTTNAGNAYGQANAAYAQANSAYGAANNRVLKAGDTMTGQLNISSGGLLVTGNVGVGMASPTHKLSVYGTVSETNPVFGLLSGKGSTTFNDGAQIAFGYNGSAQYMHFVHTRHNSSPANNSIDFYVSNGTQFNSPTSGSTHVMSLNGGNVGIGTTNPAYLLDVQGGTARFGSNTYNSNILFGNEQGSWGSGIRVYDNNDAELRIWHLNGRGQIILATGYNGNGSTSLPTDGLFIVGDPTASPSLKIGVGYTAANLRGGGAKFAVNGNVGIGTTSPISKTTITKAVTNTVTLADSNNASHLTLAGSDALVRLQLGCGGASLGYAGWIQASYDNTGGAFGVEPLLLNPSGGNVGIGNTTPQRKLDVTGSGILASFGSQMGVNSIAGIHFGYSETPSNNDLYKKSAMIFERTDNHNQGGNASGKIHFLLHNTGSTSASGTNSAVLTLDTDGNGTLGSARVGIANTAPNHGLSVNGTAFIGGNTTIIGGTTTIFDVRAADAGYAMVRIGTSTNGSQTTGAVELTQDGAYGGGMFYNGDGSPSFATGEAASGDVITFYRMNAGTRVAVFEYPYSANTVTFRGDVYASNSYYMGTADSNCLLQRIGNNLILNQGADSSAVMAVGGAGALQLIMDTNNNETTQKVSFQKNASYNGTEVGYINEDGNMYINGTLTESSSIALKENINPITNALELISQICGVTYDRKDGSAKNRAGLIAEHVEKVLPDIVQRDCYGSPAGIQYTNLIAYLVESIKELKAEIDVLKRQ